MFVIRYTGLGWLAFILFMVVGVGCAMLASVFGVRDDAYLITFAILYVLIGTPLHWRIGRNLNSRGDRLHMFNSAPMEYWAVWYPTIAMVVFGILAVKNGYPAVAWAIGIVTVTGLFVSLHLLTRGQRKATVTASGRRQLAESRGWLYRGHAPEIRDRWRPGYGAEVDHLSPVKALSGELEGVPFLVFDTKENIGPLSYRRDSLRTICLVELPVSLPDVRLRGTLLDESFLADSMPPVAAEPPWNCDLLPRLNALALIESGDAPPMTAESDVPGFAEALVTENVVLETLRRRIPGWRIHGRDLVFVTVPDAASSLSAPEAMAVVSGLAAVARALPAQVLQRFPVVS